ncbi:hypothetical protein ACFQXA_24755 [Nocardiopsis composta]
MTTAESHHAAPGAVRDAPSLRTVVAVELVKLRRGFPSGSPPCCRRCWSCRSG